MYLASPATDFYAALGSMIGGIAGVLAVVIAGLLFWRESRNRRNDKYEESVARARLVVVRLTRPGVTHATRGKVRYEATNYGTEPIHDLRIMVYRRSDRTTEVASARLDLLPPKDPVYGTVEVSEQYEGEPIKIFFAEAAFNDADGYMWARVDNGQPIQQLYMHKKRGLLSRVRADYQ